MPACSHGRARQRGRSTAHLLLATTLLSSLVLYAPRVASAQPRTTALFTDLGTLTTAVPGTVDDIDPATDVTSDGGNVRRNIDGTLVTLVGASMVRFQPALATSWSANANHSVYLFHLRHGVRFHSPGSPGHLDR